MDPGFRLSIRMMRRLLEFAGCFCLALSVSGGQAALRDDFESPEPRWRDAGGDARYRVELRERIAEGAHSGARCEFLELIVLQAGTSIYLSYDIGQAPVIDETNVSLHVRGDRPGMQLLARVVFPRAVDPRTGRPASALISGSSYVRPGEWERLSLAGVKDQVEQQARVLRAQLKIPVETEQAYLDRVLVNAYVGTGATRVWFDDLEVAGIVSTGDVDRNVSSTRTVDDSNSAAAAMQVELRGQALLVGGKSFFPRIIEHRGEPPAFLQQLGFNTLRVREVPSLELLAEAKRLGMWIVCPPPQPPDLTNPYGAATGTSTADFGPQFAPVLAWDMGDQWTADQIEILKRWCEFVRRGDLPQPRPLLGGAVADLRMISRQVDVVEVRRLPLGTTFELSQYSDWLHERSRLTRPGTPLWATIQTEPTAVRLRQAQLLTDTPIGDLPLVESEQIRLMLYESMAAGVRGAYFESQSPLNTEDAAARYRAATLQLLNLELELVDPWTSSGTFVARVPGTDKDVSAALLQIDRGHLLLPMWTGEGAQYVPGQSSGLSVSFVVPGVPESVDVLEITPGGLRPLTRRRVAGGLKVTLDEFSVTSLVLLTQDPQVVAALARRLAQFGKPAAERQRSVVQAKLRLAEEVHMKLIGVAPRIAQAESWLTAANNSLGAADGRMAEGNLRDAYLEARRAMRPLALLERAHWKKAVEAGRANAGPFTASFTTLPQFWRMHQRLEATPKQSWNPILAGGDFESLEGTLAAGWRHYQHPQAGIRSDAELSAMPRRNPAAPQFGGVPNGAAAAAAAQPIRGRFCLRLAAEPLDQATAASLVETPPVWITSPGVSATAGQLLRFRGWVRVTDPIAGSLDGLVIFDSICGENGEERFTTANKWTQFTFYRVMPEDGVVTMTAALTGFGEVFLDDFTIEAVR